MGKDCPPNLIYRRDLVIILFTQDIRIFRKKFLDEPNAD